MPIASELPIDTSASATDMADTMFGNGVTVVSATYTGAFEASGTYSNGDEAAPGITPSDTGVILSTGNATSVTNSSGDVNTSAGTSTSHGLAGDSDLNAISGQTTYDASILEAEFVPEGSTLTMQIVFSSEEYLEYVDSGFNDAVGIWVNGEPAELTVGSGNISIDEINDTTNENLYIDNAQSDDTYNTEMDGFTVTLTLKAPVTPGEVNTIKIGIADGGDSAYDSNLMIAGDSVQTALVAGDDEISVQLGGESTVDLLANDSSSTGSELTITHINGQPVEEGDTVTLPTGEVLELTSSGFVVASASDEVGDNFFTYTVEDEDGNSDIGLVNLTTTPCFTGGTFIRTPDGERPVESLAPGDLVDTLDNGPMPLLWVGCVERLARGKDAPVEISKSTLGATRNTMMSPQHRVLIQDPSVALLFASREVFVRAKHLTNGSSIRRMADGRKVAFYHLLLASHQVIVGDGVFSESFQPSTEIEAGFDPEQRASLRSVVRQHRLLGMKAARPSLKQHETELLPICRAASGVVEDRLGAF